MEISMLVNKLMSNSGPAELSEFTSAKVKALHFSAKSCPSCTEFTKILSKFYKKVNLKKGPKELEIIFVSADKSSSDFQEYYKEMPWLAIPFEDSEMIEGLQSEYQVEGIPSLVIVDNNLQVLRLEGFSDVYENYKSPKKALKLWKDLELSPQTYEITFKKSEDCEITGEKIKHRPTKFGCFSWVRGFG